MDSAQFEKLSSWFQNLDHKISEAKVDLVMRIDSIQKNMVTAEQFENRFQAIMTSLMNLYKRVESYKDQQDGEILLIKRAIRDMEEELKQVQNQMSR